MIAVCFFSIPINMNRFLNVRPCFNEYLCFKKNKACYVGNLLLLKLALHFLWFGLHCQWCSLHCGNYFYQPLTNTSIVQTSLKGKFGLRYYKNFDIQHSLENFTVKRKNIYSTIELVNFSVTSFGCANSVFLESVDNDKIYRLLFGK